MLVLGAWIGRQGFHIVMWDAHRLACQELLGRAAGASDWCIPRVSRLQTREISEGLTGWRIG